MSKDWIDNLTAENYPPLVIRKGGLDIRSEVAAVRRRPMLHGPSDYVTVWIKSSYGDTAVENTMSFVPREAYTKERFEEDFLRNRARFAELLAKDIQGTAPARPVYYFTSIWNPDDPSKRINCIAALEETVPLTLVQKEMCDALQLKNAQGGLKSAAMKVVAKTFVTEVQPAEMSIPVIVGRDLIDKARAGQTSPKPVEGLFLTEAAQALIAQRRAKDKTILVIGSYSGDGMVRMRALESFLFRQGYDPVLLVDFPSSPEPLETKFLSFAMPSKFVMYESSFPSGAIDEYKICKDNRIVTAVLYEEGRRATGMQDYAGEHKFIREFPYTLEDVETVLKTATTWAEEIVNQRKSHYEQELQKERYK